MEQSVQRRGSATFRDTPDTIQGHGRDLVTSTGRHAPLSDISYWSKAAAAVKTTDLTEISLLGFVLIFLFCVFRQPQCGQQETHEHISVVV